VSSVAILRAAGLTDAQIVKVKELEEAERKAARKEQNRKAQQNHRARKQISADAADQNGKVQQNQQPSQHFSASNADMADALPTPKPIVEQNQQPSQQISADHADKPDILSSSFLLSFSGEPLKKGSASKKVSSGGARYSDEFEKFWLPYPRTPNMAKKEAFDVWLRMSPADRSKAIAAVPGYRKFLSDKPDHPTIHACRFLSKRRFDGFAEAQAPPTNGAGPLPGSPAWRKIHGWPAEGLPGDEINPRLDLADSEPEDQGVLRGIAKVHRGDAGGEPQFADGSDHGLWMS